MILYAEVSGCSIAVSQPPLSGGTVGAAEVVFRFDKAWAGLAKTAVFRKRGIDTLVLIQNDRCALPPEATEASGEALLGVFGVSGARTLTTPFCRVSVAQGVPTDGRESVGHTPSLCEQLLTEYARMTNVTATAVGGDSAAATVTEGDDGLTFSFVLPKGDKGEKGDKGDTGVAGSDGANGADGADGYTPQRGIDYWTDADKAEIRADAVAAAASEAARANQAFANALRGSASGEVVTLDNVSPVVHTMDVKISGVSDPTAITVKRCGKNILPYPYSALNGTKTMNGITFTDNGDGSITVNGTATAAFSVYLYNNKSSLLGLKPGCTVSVSKNLSDDAQKSKVYFSCNYYDAEQSMKSGVNATYENSKAGTVTENWVGLGIYLHVPKDSSPENLVLRPQIEIGGTPTAYEPYVAAEYTPDADGRVDGVTSLYPHTTLTTDTNGVFIDVGYNKDANKVIEKLEQAIISLGGNV